MNELSTMAATGRPRQTRWRDRHRSPEHGSPHPASARSRVVAVHELTGRERLASRQIDEVLDIRHDRRFPTGPEETLGVVGCGREAQQPHAVPEGRAGCEPFVDNELLV